MSPFVNFSAVCLKKFEVVLDTPPVDEKTKGVSERYMFDLIDASLEHDRIGSSAKL